MELDQKCLQKLMAGDQGVAAPFHPLDDIFNHLRGSSCRSRCNGEAIKPEMAQKLYQGDNPPFYVI